MLPEEYMANNTQPDEVVHELVWAPLAIGNMTMKQLSDGSKVNLQLLYRHIRGIQNIGKKTRRKLLIITIELCQWYQQADPNDPALKNIARAKAEYFQDVWKREIEQPIRLAETTG